jgi:hypothetical protein
MKVTIKSPRANKRKLVVPFAGEENFIVPKQGGFGQPDHEEYISIDNKYANATAPIRTNSPTNQPSTQIGTGIGSSTLESGNSTSTSSPNQNNTGIGTTSGGGGNTNPNPTPTPEESCTANGGMWYNNMCNYPINTGDGGTGGGTGGGTLECPSGQELVNGVCRNIICPIGQELVNGVCTPIATPPPTCPSGQTLVNGVCKPIVEESTTPTPTFPDFSTLDCSALQSEISRIQLIISAGGLTTDLANAYNNALATAKNTYTSKCNTPSSSSSPIIIAPIPAPALGGGFGGGIGGGGFGEPPADETNITEQTTTQSGGLSWFWIVAILGGIYFLTKGSKQ